MTLDTFDVVFGSVVQVEQDFVVDGYTIPKGSTFLYHIAGNLTQLYASVVHACKNMLTLANMYLC